MHMSIHKVMVTDICTYMHTTHTDIHMHKHAHTPQYNHHLYILKFPSRSNFIICTWMIKNFIQ